MPLVSDRVAFRDELSLRHHLRSNNLFVLKVAERQQGGLRFNRKVRLGDLIIMSRQLRTMVMAGTITHGRASAIGSSVVTTER